MPINRSQKIFVIDYQYVAKREFCNQFVIEVLNGKVRPHEYSRIAWNFLARGGRGSITVEVYYRPSMLKTALWGNGNFVLCDVFLFYKSDHKPIRGSANEGFHKSVNLLKCTAPF